MKLYKHTLSLLSILLITSLGFAQSYKVVTIPTPGELEVSLGDDWDKIDSIVVHGTLNKADFKTLYNCSRLGKLTVINLEKASVENNKIPDFAIYYPGIMYDYLNIQRIILPDNVTEIGKYAFGMLRIKKINFPKALKKFSEGSFKNCHWMSMDPLVIPEGITEIPWLCFSSCQSFRKLVLPKSLKTLAGFSFWNTRMEEMNLPDGLETIGQSAFWGSGELKRVVIPESVVNLELGAFAQNDSLKSINIPHGITEIPDLFLAYSNKIDTIIIPDNITTIGENAFQLDGALTYIRIPKYLKSIGCYAFQGTDMIETVLPETVEFIGRGAFSILEFLKKVYCMAKNPPIAELDEDNDGPFYWSGKECTLYVPKGSGDLYRSASGWQDFKEIIETDNFPSSCGITFAPECTVISGRGIIKVNNLKDIPVAIKVYNINGTLIEEEEVKDMLNIEVLPGIYIVKAGNKAHKVVVK